MSDKKLTLDDIFNDDAFGILDTKSPTKSVKTDEDRLIDDFEEINVFFDKNQREPSLSSMSEFTLLARLKKFGMMTISKKHSNHLIDIIYWVMLIWICPL